MTSAALFRSHSLTLWASLDSIQSVLWASTHVSSSRRCMTDLSLFFRASSLARTGMSRISSPCTTSVSIHFDLLVIGKVGEGAFQVHEGVG